MLLNSVLSNIENFQAKNLSQEPIRSSLMNADFTSAYEERQDLRLRVCENLQAAVSMYRRWVRAARRI